MELGALVCTPLKPACLLCPLGAVCEGRKTGAEAFPNKVPKAVVRREEKIAVIPSADGKRWWCVAGPEKGRLAGFWRFPEFDAASMKIVGRKPLAAFAYSITKYRVRLAAWEARFLGKEAGAGRWCSLAEMEAFSMPSAHRRLREALG